MTLHIDAVFEQGAFRPAVPVTLEEGTQVALTIETQPPLVPPRQLVISLAEVASMPAESADDGFSSIDHDKILYGSQGAR
jgi:predicted DNA-binding antitoxin AbrB/MazE fold protein